MLSLPVPGATRASSRSSSSNVAFLMALALLVRLGTPYLGRRRASLAAGLLVIYPFASVFAMAYTESLFLLLMVAAFLAAERRTGRGPACSWRSPCCAGSRAPRSILPLLDPDAPPGRLAAAPLAGSGCSSRRSPRLGVPRLHRRGHGKRDRLPRRAAGVGPDRRRWRRAGRDDRARSSRPYQAALVLTLLWSVFLLVFVRVDRLRPEYWLVPVVFIAAEISSGSLEAVGRITMLAFPYVWILANRRSILARRAWPVVSVGLFTLVAVLAFGGYWVACRLRRADGALVARQDHDPVAVPQPVVEAGRVQLPVLVERRGARRRVPGVGLPERIAHVDREQGPR